MGRAIGIIAIKGGVGKTTISSSLAASLANEHDKKILLIDANYSAPNVGLHMDIVKPESTIHDVLSGKLRLYDAVHKKFGVDVVPGSYFYTKKINPLKLKQKVQEVKNDYDFVIIDSSPALNEEILSTIVTSDHLFVVTTPDYPTLACSLRAAKLAKNRGKPIDGIIINKSRMPDYELDLRDIEKAVEIPVLARIPDDKTNIKALFERIPTSIYDRKSKFAKEIHKLAGVLVGAPESVKWWQKWIFGVGKDAINRQVLKKSYYEKMFNNVVGIKDEK